MKQIGKTLILTLIFPSLVLFIICLPDKPKVTPAESPEEQLRESVRWHQQHVNELIEVIQSRSSGGFHDPAVEELAKMPSDDAIQAMPKLISTLQSSNAIARLETADLLGRMGDAAIPAIPGLITLLDDKTILMWTDKISFTSVSSVAADSLGRLGKPGVEALLASWRHRTSTGAEYTILNDVFRNMNDPRAFDLLIQLLNSEKDDYRSGAAVALANLKDRRAISPLINVLQHDSYRGARCSAAYALGEIGAEEAIQPLTNSLNDSEEYVRKNAAEALEKVKAVKIKSK